MGGGGPDLVTDLWPGGELLVKPCSPEVLDSFTRSGAAVPILGIVLVPTPARVAVLAVVAVSLLSCPAARASIAPATPIDGPSAAILGVDGVAMSEDGTGGLVYRKRVNGRVNVFVSRFTAKGWQAPQRVDVGQNFNSSWPAIGAGDNGRLVVTWVHEFGGAVQNRMYSAVLGPGATRFQPPIALDLDVREGLDHPARQLDPLLDVEQRLLVGIDADADHEVLEEQAATTDHVEVAQRERVERPGEDGRARWVRRAWFHGRRGSQYGVRIGPHGGP